MNIIIILFNIKTDIPQSDYKYSMSRWSHVITGVKFNCTAAAQGAFHIKFNQFYRLSKEELVNLMGAMGNELGSYVPVCYPLLYGSPQESSLLFHLRDFLSSEKMYAISDYTLIS